MLEKWDQIVDRSALWGDIWLLSYVYKEKGATGTHLAITNAAHIGRTDIVQYLCEIIGGIHIQRGCLNNALDEAFLYGHIETYQYITNIINKNCHL